MLLLLCHVCVSCCVNRTLDARVRFVCLFIIIIIIKRKKYIKKTKKRIGREGWGLRGSNWDEWESPFGLRTDLGWLS